MSEDPKTPHQIEKAKEEARQAGQIPYDPKLHGMGTMPVVDPQSVKELYKVVKELQEELEELVVMVMNLQSRLAVLENKPVVVAPKDETIQ